MLDADDLDREIVEDNQIFIMRGLPGTGKDWWVEQQDIDIVVSADEFFVKRYGKPGEYNFDPSKLTEAHAYCYREFLRQLPKLGDDETIAVCNTNVTREAYTPYVMGARAFDYTGDIKLIHMFVDTMSACERNIHDVPSETIMKMSKKWEKPKFHHPDELIIDNM